MQGLHVLHVLHTFPPDSYGGIETYVDRLAHAQQDDGVDVTILAGCEGSHGCETGPSALREKDASGLRVLRVRSGLNEWNWDNGPATEPNVGALLAGLLRRERIAIVHVHHWHNLYCNVVAWAQSVGVPVIITLHDYFVICPFFFRLRHGQICLPDVPFETCVECVASETREKVDVVEPTLRERNRLLRSELEMAAARLTLSNDQSTYCRQVPALRGLEFQPLLLPQPDVRPESPQEAPSGGRLRIVSWGTLVPGKGMLTLVRACEALARPERLEIHHYGRTVDAGHALELTQAARRSELVLHGVFDRATMERDFPRYDLAVFPSLFRETWGYAVDEAMALGLPVVVSDRGAPRERVGRRGVCFPAGNVRGLQSVIERFLNEPHLLAELRAADQPRGLSMAEHWAMLREIYERTLA